MSLFQLVLVIAVSAIVLPLCIRWLVWRHFRDRRLRVPRIDIVSERALPRSLIRVFRAAEHTLGPMGFEPLGARWVDSVDACEGRRPERVYYHRESGALAFVAPPLSGMGERPYMIAFVSCLADGSVLATFDGLSHLTPGFPPGWECRDHDVNDLGKQWALHLHTLEPRGGLDSIARVSLEEWTTRERDALADTLADWERTGLTRRVRSVDGDAGEGARWRFRLQPAWSLAGRFLQGQRRVLAAEAEVTRGRARQQLWRDSMAPVTDVMEPGLDGARAASMAWGYAYDQNAKSDRLRQRSGRSKWWIGALGGVVCLAIFGWWLGWMLASILVAVLLIHELGHLAAMEAFGYRDRRILFLPFFGAAALGEKLDASPAQRTLVYLLGPAPGILLGLAALYGFLTGGGLWWLAAATAALLVNYLNLLPISPLDGGRVVETLLLGRFPRAQVVFLCAGAFVFALGAWLLRDPILAGISLALVISLRHAWTAAGALARARRRVDRSAPEEEKLRVIFELLQEAPYASSPAATRVRLAEVVIPRLGHEPASLRTALAGGLVYLTMLVGVPLAVTGSVYTFAPTVWESVTSRSQETALASTVVEQDPPSPEVADPASEETDEDAADAGLQPSWSSISEASLVGR